MADVPVPSIVTATPAAADTVLGVQGGAVKRFNAESLAGLAAFTQAGTGTVARTVQGKLSDVVSVFDYMTPAQIADVRSGVGALDVTVPFQKAIDDVTTKGGRLHAPAGVYKANLSITKISPVGGGLNTCRFTLSGDGHSTIIRAATSAPVLTIGVAGGSRLHDVSIDGVHFDGAALASVAIKHTNASRVSIKNCRAYDAIGAGILYADDSYGPHMVENCLVRNNRSHGIHVDDSAANNGNALSIVNTVSNQNGGSGVRIDAGASYSIVGSDIESNGDSGIVVAAAGTLPVNGVHVAGNYIEGHNAGTWKAGIVVLNPAQGVSISGNYINLTDNLGQLNGVYVGRSFALSITGNSITGLNATGTGVHFTDETHTAVELAANHIETLATRVKKPAGGFVRFLGLGAGVGSGFGPVANSLEVESAAPRVHWKEVDQVAGSDTIYAEMQGGALVFRNAAAGAVLGIRPYAPQPHVECNYQLRVANYASASRPPPYAPGAVIYDSTLKKLILYDGTAWRNVDGTAL